MNHELLDAALSVYNLDLISCNLHCMHCRQFYLVVDGGSLYTYETIEPSTHYPVYVPLSVFGKYFFHGEDRDMHAVISPSPYCYPR